MSEELDRLRRDMTAGKRVDLGRPSTAPSSEMPTDPMTPPLHEADDRDLERADLRRRVGRLELIANYTRRDVGEIKANVQIALYAVLVLVGSATLFAATYFTAMVVEAARRAGDDQWIVVAAYGVVLCAAALGSGRVISALRKPRAK